jgi:hypothetical protein
VFAQREETKLIATLCEGIMRIRITHVETPNYKKVVATGSKALIIL